MNRDELIEAAYNALIARYPVGETYWKVVEATVDAVEPLIQADERARMQRQAASVVAYRTNGTLELRIEDPHDVGWTPIALDLLRSLVDKAEGQS